MEKPNPSSSTVCSLGEAPDAWRGYLSPAEIVAELDKLLPRIRDDALHAKLKAIRDSLDDDKGA
ncbi:hypothetical protein [Ferrovibrio sp.]|uniref:hypothetical protein n=1 Tax=Ferrovibrio sp. TaxID=1917215 RepID=UPI000CBA35CF|nr:hypothetical protein [Ferrovibrio sp.]PJI42030.1 MAG: hypothetical protein CTR53_06170 [Ferrovibrio sp.]